MSRYFRRSRLVAVSVCLAGALGITWAIPAHSFELKHTQGGQLVRWSGPTVDFIIGDSVEKAANGGSEATVAAARGWSGESGAPKLSAASGDAPTLPAVDGKNTVLFAPTGYEPAGSALAVTVLSYDATSGEIVDADIVINGPHRFAVFPQGTQPPAGAEPVSTEGGSASGSDVTFDLQHVVAHEFGHSLGLSDASGETAALMYPYTLPNDALVRTPEGDDLNGIDALYSDAPNVSASQGCGANVAGARVRAHDALAGLALLFYVGGWLISRRPGRAVVPWAAAWFVLMMAPGSAHSSSGLVAAGAGATARVVAVKTQTAAVGIYETIVDSIPTRCVRVDVCPGRVRAHVWGGTMGGITQVVGDIPPPQVDDEVDLAFTGVASGATAEGSVLAVRRP